MMQMIGVEPNELVNVKSVELPRASFVKFQPQNVEFLDISNPKAVYVRTIKRKHITLIHFTYFAYSLSQLNQTKPN
jgi:ubiquitin fusion degradation protein 1